MENFKVWTGCDIEVHIKGGRRVRAVCYSQGSGYHATPKPFINIHIPKYIQYPYKMFVSHGLKTGPVPPIVNTREELIVFILGHEIMHYWQHLNKKPASEIECEINGHTFLTYFRLMQSGL